MGQGQGAISHKNKAYDSLFIYDSPGGEVHRLTDEPPIHALFVINYRTNNIFPLTGNDFTLTGTALRH